MGHNNIHSILRLLLCCNIKKQNSFFERSKTYKVTLVSNVANSKKKETNMRKLFRVLFAKQKNKRWCSSTSKLKKTHQKPEKNLRLTSIQLEINRNGVIFLAIDAFHQ